MLTRALTSQNEWSEASLSPNGVDFFCPECRQKVRVRHAECRRAHFYHYLVTSTTCRQSGVSPQHLHCQNFIEQAWATACFKEHWFSSINRIADLFMPHEGLVVEIQYSPISLQEVCQRTLDYKSLGLEVIWIFDFEAFIHHPLMQSLAPFVHYFTTIDANGCGEIVDICDDLICEIKPKSLLHVTAWWSEQSFHQAGPHVKLLWQRYCQWPCHFANDWLFQLKKASDLHAIS